MDGVTPLNHEAQMPPRAPMAHPVQDLRRAHVDPSAPGWQSDAQVWTWRAAAFFPAIATTALFVSVFADWLSMGGMWWLEYVLVSLVAMTFFWVALSMGTATVGLIQRWIKPPKDLGRGPVMKVALLMPVYNENPVDVFGNTRAMIFALQAAQPRHSFDFFVLSDTTDADIAESEDQTYGALRASLPPNVRVWYRRRPQNIDRKSGNIAQWLRGWGSAYEAMIVLDADSLMSPGAVLHLTDMLAADPAAGLIQSSPRLTGPDTVFGRMQQFATVVYGQLLSQGLARWTGAEGNYWGHNAIIRTAAFAACAGLPRMPALWGRGRLIMSHDFVEAALLRRAGWAVRFAPDVPGSYEDSPATLIDYALRDRRWCHGNLQHLRLIGTRGLHGVSRFHLLQGAMSYLMSPVWFALLVIWALLGNGPDNVVNYFSAENPRYPVWPEMSGVTSGLILAYMYAMLLAPKFMGTLALAISAPGVRSMGGWGWFAASFLCEIVLSILYAPIMMVQQVVAVARVAIGMRPRWAPQARRGGKYGLLTAVKFHSLESISGGLLVAGMISGLVSLWLLPIAVSLIFAVPLSLVSGYDFTRRRALHALMMTPEKKAAPPILQEAKLSRQMYRSQKVAPLAAE